MSNPPPPARVYGLVAAEADVAVLLRRGPARKVLMIRWDLKTDEFELGQWLFDRAYEYTADLSADGQFFTCQILDGKFHLDPGGIYAIVSRPPYFTALALWQQFSGGGFQFGGNGFWPASSDPNRGSLPPLYPKPPTNRRSRIGGRGSRLGGRRTIAANPRPFLLRWETRLENRLAEMARSLLARPETTRRRLGRCRPPRPPPNRPQRQNLRPRRQWRTRTHRPQPPHLPSPRTAAMGHPMALIPT